MTESFSGDTLRHVVPSERLVLERGQSALLDPIIPIDIDEATGAAVVGRVELPGTHPFGDPTPERTIRIVHSRKVGFLLCPPGTEVFRGENPDDVQKVARGDDPIAVGGEPGNTVTIGREGVRYERPNAKDMQDFTLPVRIIRLLSGGDNSAFLEAPQVSNPQVSFSVDQSGQLLVTDLSANGTALEKPASQ
jgi:hypothetical protein